MTTEFEKMPMAEEPNTAERPAPVPLSERVLSQESEKSPVLAQALHDCQALREEERELEREEQRERREWNRWLQQEDEKEKWRRRRDAQDEEDAWDALWDAVRQALDEKLFPIPGGQLDVLHSKGPTLLIQCNQRVLVWGWGRETGDSASAAMTAAQEEARDNINAAIALVRCPEDDCPKRLHLAPRLTVVRRPTRKPYQALVVMWAIVGCPRGG